MDRMTEHVLEQFEALASRWDLDQLHQDLTDVLDAVDEGSRPFVPTRLQEALHMYLDSYGPHRTANR